MANGLGTMPRRSFAAGVSVLLVLMATLAIPQVSAERPELRQQSLHRTALAVTPKTAAFAQLKESSDKETSRRQQGQSANHETEDDNSANPGDDAGEFKGDVQEAVEKEDKDIREESGGVHEAVEKEVGGSPGDEVQPAVEELKDPPQPEDLKALLASDGPISQAMSKADGDATTLKESSKQWVADSKEINVKSKQIVEEAEATGKELSIAHKGVHKDAETPPKEVLESVGRKTGTEEEAAGKVENARQEGDVGNEGDEDAFSKNEEDAQKAEDKEIREESSPSPGPGHEN